MSSSFGFIPDAVYLECPAGQYPLPRAVREVENQGACVQVLDEDALHAVLSAVGSRTCLVLQEGLQQRRQSQTAESGALIREPEMAYSARMLKIAAEPSLPG